MLSKKVAVSNRTREGVHYIIWMPSIPDNWGFHMSHIYTLSSHLTVVAKLRNGKGTPEDNAPRGHMRTTAAWLQENMAPCCAQICRSSGALSALSSRKCSVTANNGTGMEPRINLNVADKRKTLEFNASTRHRGRSTTRATSGNATCRNGIRSFAKHCQEYLWCVCLDRI